MKSIVTKLVIYKKDLRFNYCPTPYYCEGYYVGGGYAQRVRTRKTRRIQRRTRYIVRSAMEKVERSEELTGGGYDENKQRK